MFAYLLVVIALLLAKELGNFIAKQSIIIEICLVIYGSVSLGSDFVFEETLNKSTVCRDPETMQ